MSVTLIAILLAFVGYITIGLILAFGVVGSTLRSPLWWFTHGLLNRRGAINTDPKPTIRHRGYRYDRTLGVFGGGELYKVDLGYSCGGYYLGIDRKDAEDWLREYRWESPASQARSAIRVTCFWGFLAAVWILLGLAWVIRTLVPLPFRFLYWMVSRIFSLIFSLSEKVHQWVTRCVESRR